MSYSVDVNVLAVASNVHDANHRRAAAFVERCVARTEPLCLAWTTLMGYLRVSTHASIFPRPLTPEEALHNLERLMALPHARLVTEQDGFLDAYRQVTAGMTVRGPLVSDAHLAAVLYQHNVCTLYTNDRDFRRFDFLDVRDPFA